MLESSSRLPVLYSFRRCPYAMRARLALAASEVQLELREVVLRDKPHALLEASPKGTVPVLVLPSGQVVEESLEIMLWALAQDDPLGWLDPKGEQGDQTHAAPKYGESAAKAIQQSDIVQAMLARIHECDDFFKPRLDRYKYPPRYPDTDPVVNRDEAAAWLKQLDLQLLDQPYLFGERPGLADMAIAPFVRQFAHTDKQWFDAQDWPQLKRWLNDWMSSELFERVMYKYSQWKEGEAGERFPPK